MKNFKDKTTFKRKKQDSKSSWPLSADLVFCRHKCEKFHTFVNQSALSKAGFGMTRIDYCLGSLQTHIYLFSSRFYNRNVFAGASSPLHSACLMAIVTETLVFAIMNIFQGTFSGGLSFLEEFKF